MKKKIIGLFIILIALGFSTLPTGRVSASGGIIKNLFIDVGKPGDQQIYNSLGDIYGLQFKLLPTMIIGETVLLGPDEVRAKVLSKIEKTINAGGSNLPVGNIVSDGLSVTASYVLAFIFLMILLLLVFGWHRTSKELKDLRKEKRAVDKEKQTVDKQNTELRSNIHDLEQTQEALRNEVSELERKLATDPTLSALLGLVNSPVDYLADAIRIIYYNDKRPADATVHDVNGYLISLLKMLISVTGIEIIGHYFKKVEFNSQYHESQEYIPDKTPVQIIEVGWKKNNAVLKKAVVEKLPPQQNIVGDKSRRG